MSTTSEPLSLDYLPLEVLATLLSFAETRETLATVIQVSKWLSSGVRATSLWMDMHTVYTAAPITQENTMYSITAIQVDPIENKLYAVENDNWGGWQGKLHVIDLSDETKSVLLQSDPPLDNNVFFGLTKVPNGPLYISSTGYRTWVASVDVDAKELKLAPFGSSTGSMCSSEDGKQIFLARDVENDVISIDTKTKVCTTLIAARDSHFRALLDMPTGCILDKDTLYIADSNNHRILSMPRNGKAKPNVFASLPARPLDICLGNKGHLYVATMSGIYKVYPQSRSWFRLRVSKRMGVVKSLSFCDGYLYVACLNNRVTAIRTTIYKVNVEVY